MSKHRIKPETFRLVRDIKRARDTGLTARQAAAAIGTTYNRVKNAAYRHGISFRGRRRAVLSLSKDVFNAAEGEAKQRGTSTERLLSSVVSTVVTDGLYNAVLDE